MQCDIDGCKLRVTFTCYSSGAHRSEAGTGSQQIKDQDLQSTDQRGIVQIPQGSHIVHNNFDKVFLYLYSVS